MFVYAWATGELSLTFETISEFDDSESQIDKRTPSTFFKSARTWIKEKLEDFYCWFFFWGIEYTVLDEPNPNIPNCSPYGDVVFVIARLVYFYPSVRMNGVLCIKGTTGIRFGWWNVMGGYSVLVPFEPEKFLVNLDAKEIKVKVKYEF